MEKDKVKVLVQRAIDDLSPRGVEHAWESPDGRAVLKWVDILGVFEGEETATIVSPEAITPNFIPDITTSNVILPIIGVNTGDVS